MLIDILFDGVFLNKFLMGFLVNLKITALCCLVGGIAAVPVAAARLGTNRFFKAIANAFLTLCRAAPVFVVLFFLLGQFTTENETLELWFGDTRVGIAVLAIAPFVVHHFAGHFEDFTFQYWLRDYHGAFVMFPNIARSIIVIFSASCLGAAIGVSEAMSALFIHADSQDSGFLRLCVLAFGALFFVMIAQVIQALGRGAFSLAVWSMDRKAAKE